MSQYKHHLDLLKTTRGNVARLLNGLSVDQLNHIPEGFNNNLIWNLGHIVVTQQLLCYALSGLPTVIDKEKVSAYRKGSKPEGPVDALTVDTFKEQLETLVTQFEEDLERKIFKEYKVYTTSYGATLSNLEDAVVFNNMHEAMHLGTMIALKKLV
ncbi:MAG: DinB family protein [Bacteroidota bacterium]